MIEIAPDGGEVRIELPQGGVATIEGLEPEITIVRGEQRALFLGEQEAEVLGKMIDYLVRLIEEKTPVAGKPFRIQAQSEATLRDVRPRLAALFEG